MGFIWIVEIDRGWFKNLAVFPLAVDKNGNPDFNHHTVLKYIKEHS
jgi:hypothetical protein